MSDILFLGAAWLVGVVVWTLLFVWMLTRRSGLDAPQPAAARPTSKCPFPACQVRHAAPAIGLAILRVASGKTPVSLNHVTFMSGSGVGRVHLLIVDERAFERVIKPALAEVTRG